MDESPASAAFRAVVDRLPETGYAAYRKLLHGLPRPHGVNVFERDWDVLVVLDACRADLLAEVADDYPFLAERETVTSVGSMTAEWLEKTFTERVRAATRETTYVCGNPFSTRLLDPNWVAELDEVWRYGWDGERGTVPPRAVSDRAIAHAREGAERLLVHYMQPHAPFVGWAENAPLTVENFGGTGPDRREDTWDRLREGTVERGAVWEAYRENLRYVCEDLHLLLANVDAERVVITADHGNALGEWGVYGHPRRMPLRCLREVPWVLTSATDDGDYEPQLTRGTGELDVETKLQHLGYK